jgi:hypothetical protein
MPSLTDAYHWAYDSKYVRGNHETTVTHTATGWAYSLDGVAQSNFRDRVTAEDRAFEVLQKTCAQDGYDPTYGLPRDVQGPRPLSVDALDAVKKVLQRELNTTVQNDADKHRRALVRELAKILLLEG